MLLPEKLNKIKKIAQLPIMVNYSKINTKQKPHQRYFTNQTISNESEIKSIALNIKNAKDKQGENKKGIFFSQKENRKT